MVAVLERVPFSSVTIVPGDSYLGRLHTPVAVSFFNAAELGDLTRPRLEGNVIVCLAGAEAEKAFGHDIETAIDLLSRSVGSTEELRAWSRLLAIRARQLVALARSEIEAVALALLEKKTLTPRAVRVMIENACASGAAPAVPAGRS